MSGAASLGQIDATSRRLRRLTIVRLLLPVGWVLASVGLFGPWIAHPAVGLTLSGVDMGEFVKFLPGVLAGTVTIHRQVFYLAPVAICVSIALLVSSRRLRLPWIAQALGIAIAIPTSLQLLPPAWSPSSLLTPEFRLQTLALGTCWLLLAGSWLLGSLSAWLVGSLSATLSLSALALTLWQFLITKPSIDEVYHAPPATGWGLPMCLLGLGIMAVGSLVFALRADARSRTP